MPVQDTIQVRRDVAADWVSTNPVLSSGEIGYETDTGWMKVGNGSTAWNSLAYFVARQSVSKTSTYTISVTDSGVIADATSGAFTITLPPASNAKNQVKWVKKVDSSANAITIVGVGSETIDDSTSITLTIQYQSIDLFSDGTQWWIK